ncbi:hypothetical protein CQW23_24612 [Capsicum baccatum]|uniref:Uncharacterized protein n=1 Tax=Capsicum baccatum TaxID=33114 RepID=A0A2G2VVC5_CAPBA|nr:hypothetical protein CQW23_24612 [Capsicum baccatum]
MSSKINRAEYFIDPNDWFKSDPRWRGDSNYHTIIMSFLDDNQLSLLEKGVFENFVQFGNLNPSGAVEAFSLEHELPSNNDSEDKRVSVLNQKLDKLQSTCSKKFEKILDENKFLESKLSEIKRLLLEMLKADGYILSDKQPDNLQEGHTASNYTSARCNKPCFVCGSFKYNSKQCAKLPALLVLLILNEEQDPGASLVVVRQGYTDRVVLDSDASLSLPFHGHDKLFLDNHSPAFMVIILEIPYFPSLLSPKSPEDFPEK